MTEVSPATCQGELRKEADTIYRAILIMTAMLAELRPQRGTAEARLLAGLYPPLRKYDEECGLPKIERIDPRPFPKCEHGYLLMPADNGVRSSACALCKEGAVYDPH